MTRDEFRFYLNSSKFIGSFRSSLKRIRFDISSVTELVMVMHYAIAPYVSEIGPSDTDLCF